jgi:hypothetical protein
MERGWGPPSSSTTAARIAIEFLGNLKPARTIILPESKGLNTSQTVPGIVLRGWIEINLETTGIRKNCHFPVSGNPASFH